MARTKQESLDQIRADIIKNNVCPDLTKQATQLVFGEGDADAEIVIIGEAPGKNEDQQGKPFVGASGKLLDEMLALAGIERKNVYITNIVKYRPLKNRDPSPAEKAAFLPYLQAQLEVIQPKIVITLGRHSMNCFLPGLQISQVHGQTQNVDGQTFVPIYHPAAAIYRGATRQALKEDFKKLPQIIKRISK